MKCNGTPEGNTTQMAARTLIKVFWEHPCVYSVDDYAKMWLQLAFPFYLIFIAISLIIKSSIYATNSARAML